MCDRVSAVTIDKYVEVPLLDPRASRPDPRSNDYQRPLSGQASRSRKSPEKGFAIHAGLRPAQMVNHDLPDSGIYPADSNYSGPALAAEPKPSVHRLWSPRPSSCQIQVKS